MTEEKEVLEIPWLTQRPRSEKNLGALDDIDFAAMLEELEFK